MHDTGYMKGDHMDVKLMEMHRLCVNFKEYILIALLGEKEPFVTF